MIKWIETGDYEKIVPLLGGFHTILVFLKILHKKYGVLGLKEWWIDSEAIQPGSADKADEGKHYFRSVRLHKQSLRKQRLHKQRLHCTNKDYTNKDCTNKDCIAQTKIA